MTYADIIVDISHEKLDKTFSYRVPDSLRDAVNVGTPVVIPFGKANRRLTGFVVALSDTPKFDPEKTKDIIGVPTDALPLEAQLIALAAWMREHFGGTMNQALKCVLPIKRKTAPKETKLLHLAIDEATAKEELIQMRRRARHSVAKERLLGALIEQGDIPWDVVTGRLDIPSVHIRDFEKKAWITVTSSRDYRNPLKGMQVHPSDIVLNDDQRKALDVFLSERKAGTGKPFLLYGVTGSGKTQVYIEMIEAVLAEGKQAIVLIPEIALTYQTVMRFYGRFGGRVSIMNSRLSDGERCDQFERAKTGDVSVMVGPRSALFTPFPKLGLIIIDEEHETTYKSEQVPKYHASEVAKQRALMSGASVVFGSATPSVGSFASAQSGDYTLLRLPQRAAAKALPVCHIVDLRRELKEGNKNMLSRMLLAKLRERLDNGEQSMLFMNRRGLAGFISCRECGYVLKCPHCDVSLSLHRGGILRCHYCGYEMAAPKRCPECGSKYIGSFKAGTQQLEEHVAKLFPDARILRMDADTTKGKDGHEKILSAFANREADILIGTQMIVKGHDFSAVTLMGIVAADISLHAADYSSAERTFDLLCQAAGRAGRGSVPGEVIIQTYQPEHYAIVTAAAQDYEAFYETEIAYRRLMRYPPAGALLVIQILSVYEQDAENAAQLLFAMLKEQKARAQAAHPVEAQIAKIKDIYRRAIYVKSAFYDELVRIKDAAERFAEESAACRRTVVRFDFNPVYGF